MGKQKENSLALEFLSKDIINVLKAIDCVHWAFKAIFCIFRTAVL